MGLFDALGNNSPNMPNQPMQNQNGFMNMANAYKEFRQTFSGDPNEIIRKNLQNGKFTQAQVDQAKMMLNNAYEMQKLFGTNSFGNLR